MGNAQKVLASSYSSEKTCTSTVVQYTGNGSQ